MFTETALVQEHMLNLGLGLYLMILVFVLFFRARYYRALITQMKEPGIEVLLSGALNLLVGVFLVLIHNVWVFEPRVFVTLMCWAYLINAILWLVIPVAMMKILKRLASGLGYYVVLFMMLLASIQIIMHVVYLYLHHSV
ncbi:MAG: hypothetical protein GW760_06375 [Legionella sp.]|jgi:magnesium-transporting ATPase (P-type)|nr:hypothetical protein [Legionella sp.]